MRQRQFTTASPLLNVMIQAVYKTSSVLSRDYGEVANLQVSKKGSGGFVTATDQRVEKKLFEALSKARPEYGFLMEESGEIQGKDKDTRWIVDPIDGTLNFMHGLPGFSMSIALERHGEITAGVTYDVLRDELFYAEKGFGAFLNGRRMRVGNVDRVKDALMATSLPNNRCQTNPQRLAWLQKLCPQALGVRSLGSTTLSLAYIAAGRLNGFWDFGAHIWDYAAGEILIKEAGGYVSFLDIEETPKVLVASSPIIHEDIRRIFKKVGK